MIHKYFLVTIFNFPFFALLQSKLFGLNPTLSIDRRNFQNEIAIKICGNLIEAILLHVLKMLRFCVHSLLLDLDLLSSKQNMFDLNPTELIFFLFIRFRTKFIIFLIPNPVAILLLKKNIIYPTSYLTKKTKVFPKKMFYFQL